MSATNLAVDVVPAESGRAASEEKSTKEDSENSPENPGRAIWTGRKGKPKTRTGCKTCKIRRIKCDEAKPFCLRCTKTGRVCDGYLDPNIKKSRSLPPTNTHIALRPSPPSDLQFHLRIKFTPKVPASPNTIPRRPLDHPNSTSRELQAIEYFLHKTTRLMSTWVISSFWKVQLPQISAAEPAVKHALVSLAVAHEAMERRCGRRHNDQSTEEVEQKRFACMHYHESVSQLGRLLQTRKDEDTEVLALMTGALFVMSKFMWGDFTTAVMHMHNEIEIYDNWSKKRSGREMVEGSLEWNVDNLVGRQCFKSASLDNDSGKHRLQDEAFYVFEDMKTAKVALQAMFAEAIRLIRLHRIMSWSDNSGFIHDFQDEIDGFHGVFLSKWLAGFNDLVASKDGRMTEKEEWESDILRTTQVSIDVWMYAGIGHQMAQPQPLELFDRLLCMGETLHQRWCNSDVPEDSATLSCDTGVVPPLLFISTDCSDPTLRDRACKLLAYSSGICTSQTQVEVSEIKGGMNTSPVPVSHTRTEFIEVEVEEGTEEVDLVLQPNRTGGWEVRHQDIV